MARNIEIKARIESVEEMMPLVAAIADRGPTEIFQDDTFFPCASGRLKLRAFSPTEGELIFYRRPDRKGPKESFYLRSSVSQPDILRESLSQAYGRAGRVRKQRIVFFAGSARIHLDRVEGLGDFLELEVVLAEAQSGADGVRRAKALMARLGVASEQLVEGAYVDLLASTSAGAVSRGRPRGRRGSRAGSGPRT